MPDRCLLTPDCQRGPHAPDAHPCGGAFHRVGDPCAYCGKPLVADADGAPDACWDCWRPITIADMKAIAADAGLDATLTTEVDRG